jgi:transcriptional regulator with XRE-family HTH domain
MLFMNDISYNNWNVMSDNSIVRQIGEFVRYHRMEANKNQERLAKDAGISRSTLSLLERGETVTIATLIRVLRVLDQLQVLQGFTVVRQQSPLLLAKEERNRRKRVASPRTKKTDDKENEDIDW